MMTWALAFAAVKLKQGSVMLATILTVPADAIVTVLLADQVLKFVYIMQFAR